MNITLAVGLEILFGPGAKWPEPSGYDVIIAVVILLVVLSFIALWRYNYYLKNQAAHAQQLFLFRTKQLGLTNFQLKILNGIAEMKKMINPVQILEQPLAYAAAIGDFLKYLTAHGETQESLLSICREIVIIHEKIYHPVLAQRPLENILEIEPDQMLYFTTEESDIYLGKVMGCGRKNITLELIRRPHELKNLEAGRAVGVYIWRNGDAEYTFDSHITGIGSKAIDIEIPPEFKRGKEVRHPYIDVIISCTVSDRPLAGEEPAEGKEAMTSGVIFKLNEHEAILRLAGKMDYQKDYFLDFEVSDFKIRIQSKITSDRTVVEENVFYYTFKFVEMTDAAKNILKKYISEYL